MKISAPSYSAAIFTFYTQPSQGTVTVYVKSTKSQDASATFNHVFDAAGHSPSMSFSIDAGTDYYVYLKGNTHPITGTLSYTKTTA